MFPPKKIKYKKLHKKKFSKIKYKKLFLNFGTIGLKALESNFISSFQLKSLNFILSKKFKRKGKIWYNFSLNIPVTSKPVEVRMGKGIGNLKHWTSYVKAGSVILEIVSNLNFLNIISILKNASVKLALKTKIVYF